MSGAKKTKKTRPARKLLRIEMSRLAAAGWCLGLIAALLWMFLLGLFLGKGITPASINFAAIKKRMVAEGVWPGSGRTNQQKTPPRTKSPPEKIPLKDLEFYDALTKKKEARLRESREPETRARKNSPTAPRAASPSPRDTRAPERPGLITARYTVQVASFKDPAKARKFASRLKDVQRRPTIRSVDLPDRGRWYRVQVGQLSSFQEATALAHRLSKQYHLQALVVRLES